MFRRVDRVSRVALLMAFVGVAVAFVSLVAHSLAAGAAFALALMTGALVAACGWRWAWHPVGARLAEVLRERDALTKPVEVARAEPEALSPGVAILPEALSPGVAILPGALSPGVAILPGALSPGVAILPGALSPGVAILPGALSPGVAIFGGAPDAASPLEGRAQVVALFEVGLRSAMRQAALAMEKAAEPEPHSEGLRFLLSLGHSASVRGQDLLLGLDAEIALDALAHPQREPFPLREDIAGLARALAFELGCEVALRFSPNFPAQVTGNRRLLRLATAATVLTCAEHGPQGAELLIEASHEDLNITDVTVRFAVSATGAPTIGELPLHRSHAADKALPALLGLSQLVELAGGQVDSNGAATQLGYSLPVVRYKRITGSTLYGLGALIDRSVLVVDPRSIGRLTICEQLAAWRLSPTGVAGVAEALTVVERARVDGERLDLVVVSGFLGEQPEIVRQLAEQLALVGQARVISLEDIETLCRPVAADLAEMPALALRRMPRPPSPNELIAVLTELLVPRPVHREVPARGPGLSLLVAEDNVVNQTLMMKMLERRGHSVRVADNGADLVDRLWEAPGEFDAVLMDIQMPVMDGLEATAVIRLREAQSQRPRMPIIAVTAHAMGGERERCLEAGMDGYLAKPIVERELTALLEAIAAQPRPGTGPEAPVRSTTEVFDRRRVLELAAGDMDFLRGLVALFGDDAPRLVSQVADHLAAGDAEAAYRKAHQLKGSIGNFGADRACTAAAELEELARNGEVARAAAKVAPLQREVDTLVSGLRALIREVAS